MTTIQNPQDFTGVTIDTTIKVDDTLASHINELFNEIKANYNPTYTGLTLSITKNTNDSKGISVVLNTSWSEQVRWVVANKLNDKLSFDTSNGMLSLKQTQSDNSTTKETEKSTTSTETKSSSDSSSSSGGGGGYGDRKTYVNLAYGGQHVDTIAKSGEKALEKIELGDKKSVAEEIKRMKKLISW